jgi:tellurite resistance protein TerC
LTTWWWVLFGALALALPMADLLVIQGHARRESLRHAAAWSAVWVSLGLLFALVVGVARGHPAALAYVTAYLVEVSLSVDNLFVFAALFAYFGVAHEHQHRVLFWGIFGAIVMRGLFIFAGLSLIARFHWLIYLLGVVLLATGARLGLGEGEVVHPERNVVVRWLSRVLPIDRNYHGDRFAVRLTDGWRFTPLVLVLVAIESTDVIFAVDSVPAVLGVSRDPFVVYTSNVFAVMGLRSLYFVLAGALRSLRFLRPALALILVLIGVKMILADLIEVPTAVSLAVVVSILLAGAGLSLLLPQHKGGRTPPG